ncbi:hypothetical protein KZJ38_05670 [Paraburkholderia edwinii]|uniref:AraC family transcriptional regulator n=1 Tax=Paraburkholderia edwinii TaxID=2861782 RepID=A0ABX8USD2_9BURK|nr:hypothetical protein [Paraburkholderia edwinii]QYD69835.1 hypothetical protein KZJ38_05670 [Paraburkholderia edwinii]
MNAASTVHHCKALHARGDIAAFASRPRLIRFDAAKDATAPHVNRCGAYEIVVGIAVTAYDGDRLVEARGDALHFFEGTASVVRSQSRYGLKDWRQILSISFPRSI